MKLRSWQVHQSRRTQVDYWSPRFKLSWRKNWRRCWRNAALTHSLECQVRTNSMSIVFRRSWHLQGTTYTSIRQWKSFIQSFLVLWNITGRSQSGTSRVAPSPYLYFKLVWPLSTGVVSMHQIRMLSIFASTIIVWSGSITKALHR